MGIDGIATDMDSDKAPLLLMNGAFGDALNWILSGQLAEQGYDVWLGNNRGDLYGNVNRLDGLWTLKEHWNFTWADMGYYDVPAILDKVLEVTGKPKATLMGNSQGAA